MRSFSTPLLWLSIGFFVSLALPTSTIATALCPSILGGTGKKSVSVSDFDQFIQQKVERLESSREEALSQFLIVHILDVIERGDRRDFLAEPGYSLDAGSLVDLAIVFRGLALLSNGSKLWGDLAFQPSSLSEDFHREGQSLLQQEEPKPTSALTNSYGFPVSSPREWKVTRDFLEQLILSGLSASKSSTSP